MHLSRKGEKMNSIDTLKSMIIKALENCNDIELLDLILKLIEYV